MGRSMLLGILPAIIVLILAAVGLFYPAPPISVSLANGTYTSECCGELLLKDGLLIYDGGSVRYRLLVRKTDLEGETANDVAVTGGHRVMVTPGKSTRYIHFWHTPYRENGINQYDVRNKPPDRLTLYGDDYSGPYDFSLDTK